MGWEFAALWNEGTDGPWQWVWRRIADDNGKIVEESCAFPSLESCVKDAQQNGFESDGSRAP
jgi:hypothetical protein